MRGRKIQFQNFLLSLGIFGTIFGQSGLNFGTVFGQFGLKFRDCFWIVRTGFSELFLGVLGLYGKPFESRIHPYI